MSGWTIFFIVLVIIIAVLVVLYFAGRKLQRKQDAQREQLEAAKQTVSMLIIDKKRLPAKDSGLPQMVIDQIPKLMRRNKMPIVKAKVGPKILSLVCEDSIFDLIPVKKEVKAEISGIYITGVRGIRGSLEPPKKKQGFFKRMRAKAQAAAAEAEKQSAKQSKTKKK